MVGIGGRVRGLKGKQDFTEGIVKLMKYFHWSLEDLKQLTIPSYIALIEMINKIEKQKEGKSKNKKIR